MLKKIISLCKVALVMVSLPALSLADQPFGDFSQLEDVGVQSLSPAIVYNASEQTYSVSSVPLNAHDGDQWPFLMRELRGDFIVRVQVQFDAAADSQCEVGWNLRKSLDSKSAGIKASIRRDGRARLAFRAQDGAPYQAFKLAVHEPTVIELERRGDTYIMRAARFGEAFQTTSVAKIPLGESLLVGLHSCAQLSPSKVATLLNVRVIIPAAKNFKPYKDYIGSNLEIMDMQTHKSRVVYRTKNSIQAPNWTRDGKALIFNSEGLLYRFDIASGAVTEVNTGYANANNNDHVISWDGKKIGISSHVSADENHSTLFVLPITGSAKPQQINATGAGHSYLHGFSPDDKHLVFTGQRNQQFNIFTIDLKSKKETQLTTTNALDDGAEYSPDGSYIYFNSNRTGLMQLWRMRADGSEQEQLTFDTYNSWFPHVSPDGKKLVFLSFLDDIDPYEHPFYRPVYLREMPVNGGEIRIIAYVYGGQGTINVPSWSPDGLHIAFVSNTQQ